MDSTQKLIEKIKNETEIEMIQLVEYDNYDTYIHPALGLELSYWISPDYGLKIKKYIINIILNTNITAIKKHEKKVKLFKDTYLKKQKRINYKEKNLIYILTTEYNKNKRIYLIGKCQNLTNRLNTYNRSCEHEVIYYKECLTIENMNLIEQIVLYKLKEYKEKSNRDRFILPESKNILYFINIINECVNFINNDINDNNININGDDNDININGDNNDININSDDNDININSDDNDININSDDNNININSDDNNININGDDNDININDNNYNIMKKNINQNIMKKNNMIDNIISENEIIENTINQNIYVYGY
jgi:hypothetical protein